MDSNLNYMNDYVTGVEIDKLDSLIDLKYKFTSGVLADEEIANIPDVIYTSWKLSYSKHVAIDKVLPCVNLAQPYKCRNIIDEVMIETAHEAFKNFFINKERIKVTMPYFMLINNEGVIMYEYGDQQAIDIMHNLNIGINANLSFDIVGTSAHSIAVDTKKFSQMIGAYCYLNVFNNLIMTAAPIEVNGEVIATLGMFNALITETSILNASRRYNNISFRAASIANAVKKKLDERATELIRETIHLNNDGVGNMQGIITVDSENNIAYICSHAKELISFTEITKLSHYVPAIDKILSSSIARNKRYTKHTIALQNKTKLDVTITRLNSSANEQHIGYVFYLQKVGGGSKYSLDSMIGADKSLDELKEQIENVARTRHSVLILGESGTGKEMVAHAIHDLSGAKGQFVAINCASIPANLIESELFGYVEGAFTGAAKSGSIGKIEYANNGTLFLDEIGDMPLSLQPVLLRFLEERTVTRVGDKKATSVNVRVIAATNVGLYEKVANKEFREDLFFRLSVINCNVPPLRNRGRDVVLLANHFIRKEQKYYKKEITMSKEVEQTLLEYTWPGNVRQLENVIISSIYALNNENIIKQKHLPRLIDSEKQAKVENNQLGDIMKYAIVEALNNNNWNYSKTAKMLNISRTTLYNKIKEYNIEK